MALIGGIPKLNLNGKSNGSPSFVILSESRCDKYPIIMLIKTIDESIDAGFNNFGNTKSSSR